MARRDDSDEDDKPEVKVTTTFKHFNLNTVILLIVALTGGGVYKVNSDSRDAEQSDRFSTFKTEMKEQLAQNKDAIIHEMDLKLVPFTQRADRNEQVVSVVASRTEDNRASIAGLTATQADFGRNLDDVRRQMAYYGRIAPSKQ